MDFLSMLGWEGELSSRMGISLHSVVPIPTAALVIMDSVSAIHKGKHPPCVRVAGYTARSMIDARADKKNA
jgi:hypothetical protein